MTEGRKTFHYYGNSNEIKILNPISFGEIDVLDFNHLNQMAKTHLKPDRLNFTVYLLAVSAFLHLPVD